MICRQCDLLIEVVVKADLMMSLPDFPKGAFIRNVYYYYYYFYFLLILLLLLLLLL